jgi:hypothetical protein
MVFISPTTYLYYTTIRVLLGEITKRLYGEVPVGSVARESDIGTRRTGRNGGGHAAAAPAVLTKESPPIPHADAGSSRASAEIER